ncbi:MAG: hypothetical protein K0Q79_3461 [Flavipsychrobacter sp.]|jgi:ABC-type cobalamin/Fe3+-siderophores transport system ATPase subunit/SAM-dependent methyltransferase|nr:hypothetical protein [Flavipsychrobacter sp.]
MRITSIDIPQERIQNGLKPIKMDRLGSVVLLAGKNGSGKSRLLNLINSLIMEKPTKSLVNTANSNISNIRRNIEQDIQKIKMHSDNLRNIPNAPKDNIKNWEANIEGLQNRIEGYKQQIRGHEQLLKWQFINTDDYYDSYLIVPFVPKSLELKDSNNYTRRDGQNIALHINTLGVNSLHAGTFARIQYIQEQWFNSTHPMYEGDKNKKEIAISEYGELCDLIKLILNADLGRDENGNATIFGFPLGVANLSDGQKILIQFCLAIHCQQKSLNDLILFFDEPENHLHPSVIIEIIEKIINRAKNIQIWIATHSVPLLSHFDPNCIWFVENNSVAHAGAIPEQVLASLLGNENEISKLQDFISLPGIFALNRHAFESLFHPPAINTGKNDPQTLQIREEVKQFLNDEKKIRILDYGAGKGRLLNNILENNTEPIEDFVNWFDYVAYDKYPKDKSECESVIQKAYQDVNKRYFNEFSSLRTNYDKESFDVILMCNVLHEIEPSHWLKLFSKDGEIYSLLSEKGILLLVEDQEMQIGEKAYQKGFIVLDTPELKELFRIKESDKDFGFSDARKDGRLKAHRIKKEYLARITNESKKDALSSLNKTAKEKVLKIRDEEINYKNGKRHGFWIQQLANTSLALEEL